MDNPTNKELATWRHDLELWRLGLDQQNSGFPPGAQQFGSDLFALLDRIAEENAGSLPTSLIIRLARQLGYALCPESDPKCARSIGVRMLRRTLRRSKKFELRINEDWTKRYDSHVEHYYDTCLANGFIERTYELSKPGGVRDRLTRYYRGELPAWSVERDLLVTKPDGMTRIEALRHAAKEVADEARRCFGYLPRRWEPNKSDRILQKRYADLLRPHVAKSYFLAEDRLINRPTLSLKALALPPGRPRAIRSQE